MPAALLSFTILDADGDRKSTKIFFPSATTPAQLIAFGTAYAPLLDAVIGGKVERARYSVDLTLPGGLKAAPDALSEVQFAARASFDNASRYAWGDYWPSFKPALFTGDIVSVGGIGVQPLIDAYVVGLAGVAPSDGHENDLTAYLSGTKVFLK
jgi:hypothetical protein